MTNPSDRVRKQAYFLWLDEGCPEGEAERHWLAAETLVQSDTLERERIEGESPAEPDRESRRASSGAPGEDEA